MEFIKTKIVCTIGPATWDPNVLRALYENGMRVARVNGAFADTSELKRVAEIIRGISDDIALMVDIKGHEVRLNKTFKEKKYKVGDKFIIGSSDLDEVFPVTYPDLYKDLEVGRILLIDDGNLEVKILSIQDGKIEVEVLYGEDLKPGKSINTPGSILRNPPITTIDIEQIEFAAKDNWDFVAASFVRNVEDVRIVKKYFGNSKLKHIAKIEDDEGVENLESIMTESDGIMIARGDMGVEIPFEKIPLIQKRIIDLCNEQGKPVIVATHMMESMVENSRPTRAEISDVANAVLDGTDAIMTSKETTMGKYPVRTIEAMKRIAKEMEINLLPEGWNLSNKFDDLIMEKFQEIVEGGSDIIVIKDETGDLAKRIGKYKFKQSVVVVTKNPYLQGELALSYSIIKVLEESELTKFLEENNFKNFFHLNP